MRNILLTIAYDGTGFCGWQRQENQRTVQGRLEEALSIVCLQDIKVSGTSRTDSGVHALGQCASFTLPDDGIPTDKIALATNDILAFDKVEGIGDIRIISAREMPEGFHARHSAKGKRYIYRIYNCREKSPFRRTQFYQVDRQLDLDAMRKAAAKIEGTHDFKSFETAGSTVHDSTVRTVYSVKIEAEKVKPEAGASAQGGDADPRESFDPLSIKISVEGDAFLYNMVRIIVGTLVEVGLHRIDADDIEKIIESKDRGVAGHTAPAQGLYLDEVFFDEAVKSAEV
ncbi:MAG: tRNA pseudouridine(38-40) synthase TruA [Firmicutes bacterium]|nr:tRNA pseudouridine(38-40) synthase TruA [Bacillota bacterium]